MIAGIGDLPRLQQFPEAEKLESRKDSCRADVERALAMRRYIREGVVKINMFFESAAADLGFADDEPVGFAGRPVNGVETVRGGNILRSKPIRLRISRGRMAFLNSIFIRQRVRK
jgi:hypothetical protein